MPPLDFANIQIQAALISGIFTVLSAIIAAIAAAIIGKTIANGRQLEDDLETAIDDIAFLLKVERIHCEDNKRTNSSLGKNTVRDAARNAGLGFSGKFTPGVVRSNKRR